jgi:lipoyl(octanoyl) transferase
MEQLTYFTDLGISDYREVWERQDSLFKELIHFKQLNEDLPQCEQIITFQHLIFCEHPHVYTLGKSGDGHNLLINNLELHNKKAQFIKTNRGGDITYHGPGQLVGYPIFDLENLHLGIKDYIYGLEEAIIRTIAEYGLKGETVKGAIGVWLEATDELPARKICAIGVKVSRQISMHGFALNVNTDLDYFNHINPCGFVDKKATSMQKELGKKIDMRVVKNQVKAHLTSIFNLKFHEH